MKRMVVAAAGDVDELIERYFRAQGEFLRGKNPEPVKDLFSRTQTGEFQGNDVSGEFRATLIFAEREGRWLLAGLHLSPIAGAPSFLTR
jgi:hypothetical protein